MEEEGRAISGSVFVDTSIFYAAADSRDGANRRAKKILSCDFRLVTSDHVLVETWGLLRSRGDRWVADRFWAGVRAGTSVDHVGPADLEVAWAIGESWPDQDFSIVDRTSFAVMQRLGVHRVATLDDHFGVFRFGPRRERSFELVR